MTVGAYHAIEASAECIDFGSIVRPGDTVVCSQGSGEPTALTQGLMRQRAAIGRFKMFIGGSYSSVFKAEQCDFVDFVSYAAIGAGLDLARSGLMDIIPVHYGQLPSLMSTGMPVDVALLQLSEAEAGGRYTLGMVNDYAVEMARRARVVVAEINAAAPATYDNLLPDDVKIDFVIHSDIAPSQPNYKPGGDQADAIARHVAGYIADGATIEIGIGSVPDKIWSALSGHRNLGVHSGTIGEALVDMVESGIVNNSRKPIDTGLTVVALLSGGARLAAFAHRNSLLAVRPAAYTHSMSTLASLKNLVAVNSALEVDLTGQVNAEMIDGRYVGGLGGLVDFSRGAAIAENGRSIVALNATAKGGSVSRIVPRLDASPVTLGRSDVDTIVTEFGAAELKGVSLAERAKRLIAISHPDFKENLARQAHRVGKAGW